VALDIIRNISTSLFFGPAAGHYEKGWLVRLRRLHLTPREERP
jgi:hypothetical protein